MPSAYDLYTFYLEPETLRGRSVAVHVEQATSRRSSTRGRSHDEPKIVVRFHGKKLGLCCNKTQAGALVEITGTDDFSKWVGHTVTLTPARIDRERQTITITPAPAQASTPAAAGSSGMTAPVTAASAPAEEDAGWEEGEEDTGS